MNDDRSLERAVRSWIEAGPTQAPESAVEDALLRIQTTTQERDLRVPWRFHEMNIRLRIAVGLAAVVAVALLAVTLLPARPGPGVGNQEPNPTSSPTTTATRSPASSAAVLHNGPLTAGVYTTQPAFPVPITVTVPDGWEGLTATGPTVSILDAGAEGAAYLGFWIVDTAQRDPCGLGGVADTPVGPTARELAEAFAGAPGFDATGPTAVSVDGIDGEYVVLTGPLPGCTGPELELWRTPDGSCRCMEPVAERNRLWILEVDGNRLVIDALEHPASDGVQGTSSADLEELQGMIDSIQISQ